MNAIKEYKRIGTMPHRSYYIPFAEGDSVGERLGIIDRSTSSLFTSLDGVWRIKALSHVEDFDVLEKLDSEIPVPSCVQMHGFDRIQYLNTRYPFAVIPPCVPYENPSWHYRRAFGLDKKEGERYYLNFEGVDSAFYLYVNGVKAGYSQISHATSEFDITELVKDGENLIDVHVIKWCASTYLECQDKFRFSGIFRSVYLLTRPEGHITDYKLETRIREGKGILTVINESTTDIKCEFNGDEKVARAGACAEFSVENAVFWSAECPKLYPLRLHALGEMIEERVGFREVSIDGCVFKVNKEAVKLKGVNRHEFNCDTGATITLDDMARDIEIMKELNVNAVRTSHYPDCPEFYLLTDAHGIYVMDEADLEMHGACVRDGRYEFALWREYAEDMLFAPGITDRHTALVERDKNRSSVIIWSLGNESSFGQAFFEGVDYIRKRDNTRPVHYESLQQADPKYYYTDKVDMVSMMYPSIATIREKVLDNPEETRPFVMCEYTHAMGNSSGDVSDYWELIYSHEQMMGAFVWEWADHGIRTENGFLYGGDFGEREHDGNFCIDGLLTPDRKIKSSALEMKAVYGGKLRSEIKEVAIPETKPGKKNVEINVDPHTGALVSLKTDGKEILKAPLCFNITRYTDNDRDLLGHWYGRCHLDECRAHILYSEKTETGYRFEGVLSANCLMPAVTFELEYKVIANELTVDMGYKLADYVQSFPRFGIELIIDKSYNKFSYVGYGPTETYVDKHIAAEYGYYESCAEDNYDRNYVRPQESGSHYRSTYLSLDGLFTLTADKPFSFSFNPYSTEQLRDTAHTFELPMNDYVSLCLDLAMRGVGSHSCGPKLDERYEIPREGSNSFKLVF